MMKTIRRSLLLAGMLMVYQFIFNLLENQILVVAAANDSSSSHLFQFPPNAQQQAGQQRNEPGEQQQTEAEQQQRTLRGFVNGEDDTTKSAADTTTTTSTTHDEKERHRQERRRLELRERHAEERVRIRQLFTQQQTVDVIVSLDDYMGRSRGGDDAAQQMHSDFERTNAKIMTVSSEQYEAMQHDPHVLSIEVDELVYPQQQQDAEEGTISLQAFSGQEQTPWNIAAVLQHDFTTIPSKPQPMVNPATSGSNPACAVKVCVIDSGCLVDHPDLPFQKGDGRIEGREFDVGTATWDNPIFYAYHGSHVVGTMLAQGQNNLGCRGIIPQAKDNGVCLLVARVFGDGPMASAKTSTIEMAAEWCADAGADVINLSLAARNPSSNSREIYRRMQEEENLLIVAASGNGGNDQYAFPASYPHVISVGSVNEQMKLSDFSQSNNQVSLVAPGEEIMSTVPSYNVMNAAGNVIYESSTPMAFSPLPNQVISGSIHNCGLGEVLCEGARGQICFMERGGTTTYEGKAENCEDAGGIAVLLANEAGSTGVPFGAALGLNSRITIPVLSVSYDDGQRLLQEGQAKINYKSPAYRSVQGTSMAAPHVAAVAAKIWAARRQCTNLQIRRALEESALDLGKPGYDSSYGHGFLQATAAYHYLLNQPEPCGIPGGAPNGGGGGTQGNGGGNTGSGGGNTGGGGGNTGGGGTTVTVPIVLNRKSGAPVSKNDLRVGGDDGHRTRGMTRHLEQQQQERPLDETNKAVRGVRRSVTTAEAPVTVS